MGRAVVAFVLAATLAVSSGCSTAQAPPPVPPDRAEPGCGEGHPRSGRLPAEVIQAVVRKNFPLFADCYDQGLRRNPSLGGRVGVKFVIPVDGRVVDAADHESDLPDREVVACVVRTFVGLSFPKPACDGQVTVIYPVSLSPS